MKVLLLFVVNYIFANDKALTIAFLSPRTPSSTPSSPSSPWSLLLTSSNSFKHKFIQSSFFVTNKINKGANQLHHQNFGRRQQTKQYQSSRGEDSDEDFDMPSPDTLISDIPASQRGIGVGIDLGTTNSAIAILNENDLPILIKVDGKNTIPSEVTLRGNDDDDDDDNDNVDGEKSNSFVYRHVKRIMGMGTISAACSSEVVPHIAIQTASQRRKGLSMNKKNKKEGLGSLKLEKMMQEARESPARLKLPRGYVIEEDGMEEGDSEKMTTSPEYVSSRILKKLFDTVESTTGERITRAVIGVPAYFNDMQREATIRAAALASDIPEERIRLLREPEAAALAYGIGKQQMGKGEEEELILVFDLGGGTFDVSILEVGGGIFEVVATGGNNMLGGSDFDSKLAQYFSKQITKHGCERNYWKDAGDVAIAMVTSAENIRIELSNTREVVLALPLSADGWLKSDSKDFILSTRLYDENYEHIDEYGMSNSTHAIFKLSRKSMEKLCLDEFLALLRPVREVAILGGALLPGDASPSAVEAVLQMEEELDMEIAEKNELRFDDFYDETGEEKDQSSSSKDEDVSEEMLLHLKEFDLNDQKKKQQRGRKRARNVQKDERKFREQKRQADEDSRRNPNAQDSNVKVRDGINGRRITQVVLVGGATRMPAIGRLLASVTGVVPQKTVNPDEAVALGCAVHVGILDGINSELQVLSPIEAAMMRALAKKRGVKVEEDDFDEFTEEEIFY